MSIGEGFARHESVNHSQGEYARGSAHVNSAEDFGAPIRRTVIGVFHYISPKHADLYFHKIGANSITV
ncbi:MAG: transposase [Roseibium sp.]|nr:transposase [Roseibium sp.]